MDGREPDQNRPSHGPTEQNRPSHGPAEAGDPSQVERTGSAAHQAAGGRWYARPADDSAGSAPQRGPADDSAGAAPQRGPADNSAGAAPQREPTDDSVGSDPQRGLAGDSAGAGVAGRDVPLAYLITFVTYGTWLHGDPRGSVDHMHNAPGTPFLKPDPRRAARERSRLRQPPVRLDAGSRRTVELAAAGVCAYRGWTLHTVHARTNHVHAVIAAPVRPEPVLHDLKAYGTRALRREGHVDQQLTPWADGGSTRYLWTPAALAAAIRYVNDAQGGGHYGASRAVMAEPAQSWAGGAEAAQSCRWSRTGPVTPVEQRQPSHAGGAEPAQSRRWSRTGPVMGRWRRAIDRSKSGQRRPPTRPRAGDDTPGPPITRRVRLVSGGRR